jgi:PhzF family phenazine biosynthesis protein
MDVLLFHVDAFTDAIFAGNPAAVCPLETWLDDELLRAVAAENNLSETAFFVREADYYKLRWFTPRSEVNLCGHATLASAFVLMNVLDPSQQSVRFSTRSGILTVSRVVAGQDDDLLAMDFPALPPWPCPNPPAELIDGLRSGSASSSGQQISVQQIKDNYFVIYESEDDVRQIRPDFALLEKLHPAGVAITAPAKDNDVDFVSRYFVPSYGIPEDPVTGSTHCSLAPYWGARLGKTSLHARQVSTRGGEIWCELAGDRVVLKGKSVLTLRGSLFL